MPAGYITDGKAEILVNVGDKIKDKKEMSRLILFDPGIDGVDPVRLSDIGTVTYTDKSSDTYAKINGENGVLLSFTKQSSYATADVSENILSKFRQLENKYNWLLEIHRIVRPGRIYPCCNRFCAAESPAWGGTGDNNTAVLPQGHQAYADNSDQHTGKCAVCHYDDVFLGCDSEHDITVGTCDRRRHAGG